MAKIKPRVKVPKKAAVGEIVEIKALISHPMHTGRAKNKKTGKKDPAQDH
jgi:sulfur-oxidizing protein SoxZ